MATADRSPRVNRRKFLAWSAAAAASASLAPLLSAGCSSPAAPAPAAQQPAAQQPAPAAPTKAAAAAQPPAKAGVIELKMDHHEPPTGNLGRSYQGYADYVNQQSDGRIHITVYPSETLSKAANAYMNCVNGVNDIAWAPPGFTPGQFPLADAYALPFVGITSPLQGARASVKWWNSNSILRQEYEQIHMVSVYCNGDCFLCSKKAVRKVEDMAGLKVRTTNYGAVRWVQRLGGNPVNMSPEETYEGMTKGIIDSYTWDWQGILSNKTYETHKYAMTQVLYNSFMSMVMNRRKYDSLPADLQNLIDNAPGIPWQDWDPDPAHKGPAPSLPEYFANSFAIADIPGLKAFLDYGGEEIKWTPEEAAPFKAAAKPVWDQWIKDNQNKGFDPAKELAALQEIITTTK